MFHKVVRWLKKPAPKPRDEEEMRSERQMAQDEAIQQATRLKKLSLAENTGWKDYCLLVQDYIDKLLQRKILTRLDTASEATKKNLEFIDREVFILQWAIQIPQQFVNNLEAELKDKKEQEKENAE